MKLTQSLICRSSLENRPTSGVSTPRWGLTHRDGCGEPTYNINLAFPYRQIQRCVHRFPAHAAHVFLNIVQGDHSELRPQNRKVPCPSLNPRTHLQAKPQFPKRPVGRASANAASIVMCLNRKNSLGAVDFVGWNFRSSSPTVIEHSVSAALKFK